MVTDPPHHTPVEFNFPLGLSLNFPCSDSCADQLRRIIHKVQSAAAMLLGAARLFAPSSLRLPIQEQKARHNRGQRSISLSVTTASGRQLHNRRAYSAPEALLPSSTCLPGGRRVLKGMRRPIVLCICPNSSQLPSSVLVTAIIWKIDGCRCLPVVKEV
ncbi:hypothetical protein JAAARDRAFT_564998 [Jaapia argillacea MUCL 33604]|uniref:Uncharacterized protein n=1 Tax=Jaapia argillacea MUCL 33604 TaxID=933084 RepID=A0A067QE48_9AGAM|nr:hypothetical protein JAAARDRAFT_564998 [Jaapia argillacea MUCL 33604]